MNRLINWFKHNQRWLINVFVYLAIILGSLILYSPYSNNPENQPSSKIKFVYQQF
jgi:predicted negative regulator of RcsB-dependent stress response